MLAFSNDRGTHGFIGIFHVHLSQLSWIAPSYDSDTAPAWSAEGRMLAWRRERDMTGPDGRDLRCVRYGYCNVGGPAFSIFVADIDSKTATASNVREIFRDLKTGYPDGAAGYGSRGMYWVGEEYLFGCETSGYVHACAAAVNGSVSEGTQRVRDLTPQSCDNQAYSVHEGMLYTVHNCDTVDSMGIARVDLQTLARTQVVAATNNTMSGMPGVHFLGNQVVYLSTNHNTSTTVMVTTMGPTRPVSTVRVSSAPSRTPLPFVTPTLVTYPSPDGLFTIHAQLFEPPNPSGSAVIFTHGGCQRQMYAAFHYDVDYAQYYALNQFLAAREGHVVLSINYRGGPGYGVAFRAANNSGWAGASEYQDVLAGAKWLAARSDVDAKRIGIYGLSYGGLNTMQAISRNSDVFAAGVANAPVVNWISEMRYDGDSNMFDLEPQQRAYSEFRALPEGPMSDLAGPHWLDAARANQKLAFQSSPAAFLDQIRSPLMLIQGDSDANVDFQETLGVVRALRARGFDKLEWLVVPDEMHGFVLFSNQLLAAGKTVEFLGRWLRA